MTTTYQIQNMYATNHARHVTGLYLFLVVVATDGGRRVWWLPTTWSVLPTDSDICFK